MSTIQNMIKYNKNFRNKNWVDINNFIDNLKTYTENDQIIIHNTILNILNKKDVESDEVDVLINIINKLSNQSDVRKTSTIIFLVTELHSGFFNRTYGGIGLEGLNSALRNIQNNIVQLLLDTFEKAKSPIININIKNFNKSIHYKATDGSIANIVGYYYDNKDEIMVIFYGREKKANGTYKSFLESIPLTEVSDFYKEIKNNNIKNNNIENFSLIKSVSGKDPKVERDGSKYKIKLKPGEDNPIIFSKLEKKNDGSYKLTNELKPANKNNIKKK